MIQGERGAISIQSGFLPGVEPQSTPLGPLKIGEEALVPVGAITNQGMRLKDWASCLWLFRSDGEGN